MHPPSSAPPLTALACAAAALLAGCGTGSEPGAYPRRVTLPTLDAPVPIPVERCGDYFIVDATVNGRSGVPLLLDSGAGGTLLDPELIGALRLGQGIDSLAIGDFTAYHVRVRPLEMTQLSAALGRRVEGIVGHPVFGGVSATWDLPRGTLHLSVDTLRPGDPGVVPTRRDRRPFVAGELDGDTLWILLDTGSSRGLTLRDPERLRLSSPLRTTGARVRVDGVHLIHSGRIAGDVRIGPVHLSDPVVDNSVSVNLVGQEVLRHFRITFDRRTDRVRFERDDAPVAAPLASGPVAANGFALVPEPGFARVGWVDSVAFAAGLREGDRVVAIDGVPWPERGCRDPGPRPRTDSVRFDVERDGERFEVVVPTPPAHLLPASATGSAEPRRRRLPGRD
jgi:hypothetical protein